MGSQKDRLHRVLIIGATPAGISAANKLGEMGIPVTLVDRDPDLNSKLSRDEWRLQSGLTLNYALRPGLLRILRNPSIRAILPGEIASLKHTRQGFSARITNTATYVDADRCILCGRCADVCPALRPDGSKPVKLAGRESLPGRPVIDKRRMPLCQESCPLGVNAQGYMALVRAGKYLEALELIRRDNVLPGICGRICTHPCEVACRRGELDEPVAIRDVKRFLSDHAMARGDGGQDVAHQSGIGDQNGSGPVTAAGTGKTHPKYARIAVVGSGPAGLAAAADLARLGHEVVILEKEKEPGGLLRYGIGPYRLPRDILDREIAAIQRFGVEIRTSSPVELAKDLQELKREFAAILMTVGSWNDRRLGVEGEDLEGVHGCIEFLWKLHRGEVEEFRGSFAVIGDGNAAYDAARSLARLGADTTIISWFPEDLIPADAEEQGAAREEGIALLDRTQVTAFFKTEDGRIGLRCARTKPGKPDAKGIPWPVILPGDPGFDLRFDRVIVAIGQQGEGALFEKRHGVETTPFGTIKVDTKCRTSIPGVYAAGDASSGPSSVVHAMASGREAARSMHKDLTGVATTLRGPVRPSGRDFPQITPDIPTLARVRMPERQSAARGGLHEEVALGLDEAQACSEAARCLQCGVCSECLECVKVCGAAEALVHDQAACDVLEHAGVVIIADPAAAPPVKGEDVIRAYSTKNAGNDVYSMMLRGFAAAAEAMTILGGSSQRMKGHGLSFTPPAPDLSRDLRLGVFLCRCDDTFGWPSEWSDYASGLGRMHDVVHSEVLPSACREEGTVQILRAIREKGLTRIMLASCVCCPLDFICSSCTDQRSRLKEALFRGTGISRAMVETCNLRGEALRFLPEDPVLAFQRFMGLVERSIGRTRKLKAMPSPARPYNFTTAVIGNSEAAARSAMTLAQLGLDVFLLGSPNEPLSEPLHHENIHSFLGSRIKSLRGTVGNFRVTLEVDGQEQVLQAGAVILGDKAWQRIPYIPLDALPPRKVQASMQKEGVVGIPFFMPGATSVPGLFLANPPGVLVSDRVKGAATAIAAASVMPRSPRNNKGYTVSVDQTLCRGCGRCMQVCPYQAVSFRANGLGGWHAIVDEALCKGCGNCVTYCPSSAVDSPYRNRRYLEQMIEEILI